jgi:hypothetical protein
MATELAAGCCAMMTAAATQIMSIVHRALSMGHFN